MHELGVGSQSVFVVLNSHVREYVTRQSTGTLTPTGTTGDTADATIQAIEDEDIGLVYSLEMDVEADVVNLRVLNPGMFLSPFSVTMVGVNVGKNLIPQDNFVLVGRDHRPIFRLTNNSRYEVGWFITYKLGVMNFQLANEILRLFGRPVFSGPGP